MKKPAKRAKQSRYAMKRAHMPRRSSSPGCVIWLALPLILLTILIVLNSTGGQSTSSQGNKQQAVQQLFANAPTSSAGGHSTASQPLPQPTQPRFIGITNLPQAPFPPAIFVARNSWQGPIGSTWIFAYAGAKTNSNGTPGQGGIVLYTQIAGPSGNLDFSPIGTFLAPDKIGALTIVAVKGDLVKLHADEGQIVFFNLLTHLYH